MKRPHLFLVPCSLFLAATAAAMPLGLRLSAQAAAKSKPAKDPLLMTEAEAYAYYAPDTAFVIDLALIGSTTFYMGSVGDSFFVANRAPDVPSGYGTVVTVDWGDGTTTVFSSDRGNSLSHEYSALGQYVVRISDGVYIPFTTQNTSSCDALCRILRWGDKACFAFWHAPGPYYTSKNLREFPDGKLPRWPSKPSNLSISHTYYNCTSLAATSFPDWPSTLTSIGGVYQNCTSLAATSFPDWPSTLTSIGGVYYNCTSLAATSFPDWPAALTYIEGDVYQNCTAVKTDTIPKWPLGLTHIGNYGVYYNCKGLTATDIPDWPTNCCKSMGKLAGTYANTGIKPTRLPDWPTGENVAKIENVYQGCDLSGVTSLPDWPTTLTSADSTYQDANLSAVTSLPAWSNCTALVNVSWCYWNSKLAVSEIPAWPTSLQQANYTYGYNSSLSVPSLPAWSNCTALTSCRWTFRDCYNIAAEVPALPPNVQNAEGVFYNCQKLTGEIKPWPSSVVNATYAYGQCFALTGNIPAWSEKTTSAANTYVNCRALTGAWTSDPAELMPTNITSHGGCVSGASDAVRELFYSDWGGYREKTE